MKKPWQDTEKEHKNIKTKKKKKFVLEATVVERVSIKCYRA